MKPEGNMIGVRSELFIKSRKPHFSVKKTVQRSKGYCWACGTVQEWESARVINNELAETWQLDKELRDAFDARESMFCPNCGCSFRLRKMAETLVLCYGSKSLKELVRTPEFKKLKIAEINSCGKLHQFFEKLPNLAYSEYGAKDPGVRSENLEELSYDDNSFDLVLTSDTLEHVPDVKKAMKEIYRVLKPGGRHVFTVPVIWKRKTRTRAKINGKDNKLEYLQEPSYHGEGQPDYLVFTEFGYDILRSIEDCGFTVQAYRINLINLNDTNGVLIATKQSLE